MVKLRTLANRAKEGFKKVANKTAALTAAALTAVGLTSAQPSFAAGTTFTELDTVTTSLTDGITAIKTNGLTIITACIVVFIVVFGIGWLIGIVRKKMSKAG